MRRDLAHRLLSALSLIFMAGCTTTPNPQAIPMVGADQRIYFIYHHWHTSILLESAAVARYSTLFGHPELHAALRQNHYIRLGWGDGDYFTGKRKTLGGATKALVASGYSAMQVLTYRDQAALASIPAETRVPLQITEASLKRLVEYLDQSFMRTDTGEVIALPSYVDNAGAFYQAAGRYHLFSNCNTWSGRALQHAGLPIRSRLRLTARSVFEQARAISTYQQQRQAPPPPAPDTE